MSAAAPLRLEPIRAEARVVALRDEGGANRRLRLAVPGWPGFAPGQFVMLQAGVRGSAPRRDPLLPRPMAVYSEAAGADGAEIEILFKVHGRGTALMSDAQPGQAMGVVGPLGNPFPDAASGSRAWLVAGGTGIASVYPLAMRLAGLGVSVQVLLGARTALDLMGEADFAALDVRTEIATEDGSRGRRGRVTALLEDALASGDEGVVYACGPTPMMAATAALAEARGRSCFVSLENPMACGFGVCLGCAAPRRDGSVALVCRDGPVLPGADVMWEALS